MVGKLEEDNKFLRSCGHPYIFFGSEGTAIQDHAEKTYLGQHKSCMMIADALGGGK
jgi:hypothetical protein